MSGDTSAYEWERGFVPTVEDPGPVSFSEDGSSWLITRDIFLVSDEGTVQAYVIQVGAAGSVLEPGSESIGRAVDSRRSRRPVSG